MRHAARIVPVMRRLAALCLILAVVVGGVGGASAQRSAQAVASSFFGIYGWSPNRAIERSTARQAGMGIAQIAIDWGQIEFAEGYNDAYFGVNAGFDYTAITPYDERVRAAAESGLQPILLIVNPPAWALTTAGTQGPLRADKVGKYADFAKRVAQRYTPSPYGARHLVLFPEPDHRAARPAGCSGTILPIHRGWGDSPAAFASMLQQTYPVVKAVHPELKVIMGALAYDDFSTPDCSPFNPRFLDDVLAAGGASYFDVFAFNAYAFFASYWERQGDAGGAYDVAAKTNALRARYPSIAAKPFFVLESGVWSDPAYILVRMPDGSTGEVLPNAEWQGGYPAKLFARALSVGIQAVVWYGMRDYPGDSQRGLLDQSDQPKRSLNGYQQATLRLTGSTFVERLSGSAHEGYVFTTATGGRLVLVWAVGDLSSRTTATVAMPGGNVRAYDALGRAAAGLQVNGDQATIALTHEPVYLMSGALQLRSMVPLVPRNVANP